MQVPPHQGEGEKDKDEGNDPRRAAEHDGGEGWSRWIHGIGEWMGVSRQMNACKTRAETDAVVSVAGGGVVVEQAVVYVSCLASLAGRTSCLSTVRAQPGADAHACPPLCP